MRKLGSASVVAVLALAPTAAASTVRATTGGSGPFGVAQGSVFYSAGFAEANRVSIALVPGTRGVVAVRDDGATIVPGERCTAVDAHEVRCDAAADAVNANVEVRDLGDEVTIAAPVYGLVAGGDGDDRLTGGCQLLGESGDDVLEGCNGFGSFLGHAVSGGAGNDVVAGGDGADALSGGGGGDTLRGGPGNDDLNDGDQESATIDADVVDGGDGADTLTYATRRAAVRVDLGDSAAVHGQAGEQDSVAGVENVYGGREADTLLGDGAANRLDGGAGADTIDGRGGNDLLLGGGRADSVTGGSGADEIVTRDLYADRVSCGDGADTVLVDRGDRRAPGCERVSAAPPDLVARRLGVRRGAARIQLACADRDELPRFVAREFEACAFDVILRVRSGGRLVYAGRTICLAASCRTLRLTRSARRLLARRRRLNGRVELLRRPHEGALRHAEPVTVKISAAR